MGIALGGIGVVSLRAPWTVTSTLVDSLDLSSVLLAAFLVLVFGVIAYFTNPSEASFRAFLTELAFRQHLSRLSEVNVDQDHDESDDETGPHNATRPPDPDIDQDEHDHKSSSKRKSKQSNPRNFRTSTLSSSKVSDSSSSSEDPVPILFHFANKASVTLRTPDYDLRNFGLLSLAVVPPVQMSAVPPHAHAHAKAISWSNPTTHGAWFIGAFGRWWLGLEINMNPRLVKLAPQDEERAKADAEDILGITDSKPSLAHHHQQHHHHHHHRPSTNPKRNPGTSALPRSKAALRERLSLQTVQVQASNKRETALPAPSSVNANAQVPPPRSITPPPLPKSASLPLHTKRTPPSPSNEQPSSSTSTRKGKNTTAKDSHSASTPLLPTTSPSLSQTQTPTPPHDSPSPLVSEILTQLDSARSAATDLQSQLEEVHEAAARTTARLQAELSSARETKKKDDEGRAQVKARTKVLDDARRTAEGVKREAEKKLKVVSGRKEAVVRRIEKLEKETEEFKRRGDERKERALQEKEELKEERVVVEGDMREKKSELKVVEEEVQVFVTKARELENAIAEETKKLEKIKAEKERVQERQMQQREIEVEGASWPPPLSTRPSPQMRIVALAPGPLMLPVRSSSLDKPPSPLNTLQSHPHTAPQSSQFRPFADSPMSAGPLSPTTAVSLIPSSLMKSMDIPLQEAPRMNSSSSYFSSMSSPTGTHSHTMFDEPLPATTQRTSTIRFDDHALGDHAHTHGAYRARPPSPVPQQQPATKGRRWFLPSSSGNHGNATSNSTSTVKEKGLNPDAKVFTLPARSATLSSVFPSSNHSAPDLGSITSPSYSDWSSSAGHLHSHANSSVPTTMSEYSHGHAAVGSEMYGPGSRSLISSPNSSPPPPPARHPMFSLVGNASLFSSFPSFHNPFSPLPEERVALSRALASNNTSRERISGGNLNNSNAASMPGPLGSGLERVSSHGSGSSSGKGSPRWLNGTNGQQQVSTSGSTQASSSRGGFDPWAEDV